MQKSVDVQGCTNIAVAGAKERAARASLPLTVYRLNLPAQYTPIAQKAGHLAYLFEGYPQKDTGLLVVVSDNQMVRYLKQIGYVFLYWYGLMFPMFLPSLSVLDLDPPIYIFMAIQAARAASSSSACELNRPLYTGCMVCRFCRSKNRPQKRPVQSSSAFACLAIPSLTKCINQLISISCSRQSSAFSFSVASSALPSDSPLPPCADITLGQYIAFVQHIPPVYYFVHIPCIGLRLVYMQYYMIVV